MEKNHLTRLAFMIVLILITAKLNAQPDSIGTDHNKPPSLSDRIDGRTANAFTISLNLIRQSQPSLSFKQSFSHNKFKEWQKNVRSKMRELMNMPEYTGQPVPKMIYEMPRDGYKVQKWEAYPLPGGVVSFLVLIPDNISTKSPAPAVLCIPGTNETKESMAGEPEFIPGPRSKWYDKNTQALHYVKMGLVAVAVDEPGAGETSDLEQTMGITGFRYSVVAKNLLEAGWNYLGFSVFLHQAVLNWIKQQPYINVSRIIISGFSLGTEPLMALGVLNPDIYAFVFNDFLCNTRERQLTVTKPDDKGNRPVPNHNISHSVPNFWKYFDFPDLCAALAPRHLIITEGGLPRDLELVKKAYELTGNEHNYRYYYYPRFSDETYRSKIKEIPEGIDQKTYLADVNVDPANHYFKKELIIPWLEKVLSEKN
ncbi:MAG: hypothetical protein KF862_01720 [Chitinophagaceae bacterium]|nr:hypothetical protein [Chitinophagaceae bacterium]